MTKRNHTLLYFCFCFFWFFPCLSLSSPLFLFLLLILKSRATRETTASAQHATCSKSSSWNERAVPYIARNGPKQRSAHVRHTLPPNVDAVPPQSCFSHLVFSSSCYCLSPSLTLAYLQCSPTGRHLEESPSSPHLHAMRSPAAAMKAPHSAPKQRRRCPLTRSTPVRSNAQGPSVLAKVSATVRRQKGPRSDASSERVLPRAWSSPPQNILKQVFTPPALVEFLTRDAVAPLSVCGIPSLRHSGDKDIFALLTLPQLLDTPSARGDGGRSGATTSPATPCSRPLARRLSATLQAVRADLGSVDLIPPNTLVVAVLVLPRRSEGTHTQPAWRVAGLVLAHERHHAYRAHCAAPDSSKVTPSSPSTVAVGDTWCTGTSFCAVQLMWVSEPWRGRGLTFAMVEVARRRVCYGHEIAQSLVAFSEPTQLGIQFAFRYAGRADFLVY